jgi:large subunit ribosomal protein L21
MYAVIVSGGKQYRVQPGDLLQVEKIEGDVGSSVKFDQVLFASQGGESGQVWIGKPLLSGATVEGQIVGQGRDEKIVIVKMKRRKQYRRTQGHRQFQTQILVTGVANGSGETAKLSDSELKEKVSKFHTNLKPKGEAFSPKILGSRKRLAQAARAGGAEGAAPAKASAKKPAAQTAPKAAAKKVASKKAAK